MTSVVCAHFKGRQVPGEVTHYHRVGRVLSFFSTRRNCDSAHSSPAPLWFQGGGAHSLERQGVGESQFRRGDVHCGTLYMCVLI
jgi:hypothetical protein